MSVRSTEIDDAIIDCEMGRRLGCNTYCCRLIVRYAEDERPPSVDGSTPKGCVDKAPDDQLFEERLFVVVGSPCIRDGEGDLR